MFFCLYYCLEDRSRSRDRGDRRSSRHGRGRDRSRSREHYRDRSRDRYYEYPRERSRSREYRERGGGRGGEDRYGQSQPDLAKDAGLVSSRANRYYHTRQKLFGTLQFHDVM